MREHEGRLGVVRGLREAFNQRDRDLLLGTLSEDVVWHVAGGHPLAGSYAGRERLWQEYLDPMWASPARFEDRELLEHGEHVVAIGSQVHNFGEGEERFEGVEIFRVEDGRVVERWEFTSRQAELDRLITRGCAAALEHAPD